MAKSHSTPSKPGAAKAPIVVIGASAGGMAALRALLAQLQPGFPAPILIVLHMAATASTDTQISLLGRDSALPCHAAEHGKKPLPGHVYLARPDQHLMLAGERMRLTKGARENRSRPAIDTLFRSAAVAYGNRVIAVILTGYLDDGTAGMEAVHRCGGLCVVQDPVDAAYPDMPQNVINNAWVDKCVVLADMGPLLTRLADRKRGKRKPVPRDVATESKIAERVLSDLGSVDALGQQVPFNCPGCGGVLWEVGKAGQLRYRCHTGHAYTAATLLAEQTAKMEETMWVALRMFEENRNLLVKMDAEGAGAPSHKERIAQSAIHIGRIRAMLQADTSHPAEPGKKKPAPRK
ncbi:chemotaxis protein CheB [Duganella sp. CT11-25]|uniref:chemotaxis protein CheB n=1 Tax=unclassified Duganella TaxID=2636909 RepID=UPI0039AFF909